MRLRPLRLYRPLRCCHFRRRCSFNCGRRLFGRDLARRRRLFRGHCCLACANTLRRYSRRAARRLFCGNCLLCCGLLRPDTLRRCLFRRCCLCVGLFSLRTGFNQKFRTILDIANPERRQTTARPRRAGFRVRIFGRNVMNTRARSFGRRLCFRSRRLTAAPFTDKTLDVSNGQSVLVHEVTDSG